jgi:hypothetical protein
LNKKPKQPARARSHTTPIFRLESPLQGSYLQAKYLHRQLEAARHLYTAFLGKALKYLRRIPVDAGWQQTRPIPLSPVLGTRFLK